MVKQISRLPPSIMQFLEFPENLHDESSDCSEKSVVSGESDDTDGGSDRSTNDYSSEDNGSSAVSEAEDVMDEYESADGDGVGDDVPPFMFIEKIAKFIRFCSNGVAVPLQDDGEWRRRRRRRSGVRMDSSNEEEEEDG